MRYLIKYLAVAVAALFTSCGGEVLDTRQANQTVTPTDFVVTDTIATDTVAIAPPTAPTSSAISPRDLPRKTLLVTPTDSASVTLMGATLSVPVGAVDKELTLSITALEDGDIARLPQGMVNVTRNATGFRLLPHGRHFTGGDARISLPVDTLAIPHGYTGRDVFVYFYDEVRKRWTALAKDTANHDNTLACALTSHFTDMIAGVLQAPEMPETQGFAPTAMSGVKAADPLQGIITMQMPQAVQSGAATLSYPIAAPAGRNGMQPSLALTYSSEGRGGWCGYGWSLQTPSIDIDTRWGVPRFDKDYETEIYLINGGQTTLQPHRSPESIERQSDREFFPRVENSFSKIVRKGSSPKDYTWEVTTRDGVTYTYKDAVRNDDGNIVHWGLSRVEEPHGDNVTYSYTERGGRLYPTEIRYTNHGDESGAYSVKITLAEGDANIRRDATTSYRLGLLQTDGELLGDISVLYKNELLARYVPTFTNGQLRKTMLTAITQYDGDGNEVGTSRLDYYDDVKDGLFGEARTWDVGNDEALEGKVIDRIGMTDGLSAIGGSRGTGNTNGGGATVGAGASPIKKTASLISFNVGVQKSFSHSWAHSEVSMTDIDGDGRPDKVFVDDDRLYYRKNISRDGEIKFAEPAEIKGASRMSLSESKTSGTSINLGAGLNSGMKHVNLGGGYTKDESRTWDWTHTYMQDFNGDGLVDIAEKGVVLFNHIGADGRPYFTKSSEDTPNPVWTPEGITPDTDFDVDTAAERREQEKQNPLLDAVRLWKAPIKGKVRITGTAILQKPTPGTDGVKVSIQHNSSLKWSKTLNKNSQSVEHDETFDVNADDKILFRLQSIYSGAHDATDWDPTIEYVSAAQVGDETRYDANACDRLKYNASSDFIHAASQNVPIVGPDARIEHTLNMGQLRDSVSLMIEDHNGRVLWRQDYDGSPTSESHAIPLNLSGPDTIYVGAHVRSRVPLNWHNLDWALRAVMEIDGERDTMCLAPEIERMYNRPVLFAPSSNVSDFTMPRHEITATETDSIVIGRGWHKDSTAIAAAIPDKYFVITPNFSGIGFALDTVKASRYTFALSDVSNGVGKARVLFADSTCSTAKHEDIKLDTAFLAKTLYADVYFDEEVKSMGSAKLNLAQWETLIYTDYYTDTTSVVHAVRREERDCVTIGAMAANVSSAIVHQELGSLYRSWGQFAWRDTVDAPVDVTDLEYDRQKYEAMSERYKNVDASNLSDDEMSSLEKSAGEPFLTMVYDAGKRHWVCAKDSVFVGADRICSSRRMESEIAVESYTYDLSGYAMNAMRMRTCSDTGGKASNGSLASIVSGGYSESKSTVRTYQSVLDLNGDGYPDWLTNQNDKIGSQFTQANGALSPSVQVLDVGIVTSKGESKGKSVGGSKSFGFAVGKSTKLATSKLAIHQGDEARMGASVSGNMSENRDETVNDWTDINGDGLPDMLFADGTARLGKGYALGDTIRIGHQAIREGETTTKGCGGGVSMPICGYFTLGGGVSYSRSDNSTTATLLDVDSDGLPDMVVGDKVYFNNGMGFESEAVTISGLLARGRSVAKVYNGDFSGGFAFPVCPWLSITVSANYLASGSTSLNRTERQLMDIDGDGVADIVESDENSKVTVRLGKIGRTNLLRSVTSPLGATTTIDYVRAGNTYDLPQSRWVMSRVTTEGGDRRNGATRFATSFEYKDGYYDRREREFLGFGEVTTTRLDTENGDAPYRLTSQAYDNRAYETRNLVTETRTAAADGSLISKTENAYTKKNVHDGKSLFIAPSQIKTTTYETGGDGALTLSESYAYDGRGNVTSYTSSTPGDSYTAEIKYHSLEGKNIFTRPSDVRVSADGKTLRQTTSRVNERGDLTRISQIADGVTAVFDMERDCYGNVTKITRPRNASGQRLFRSYTYDDTHHTLVTGVTDAFGYHSSTDYDLKWRVPTRQTDINGNETRYAYDRRGRLTSVSAPYEVEAGGQATIGIEYDDKSHTARTTNYDAKTQTTITTYLFTDDLGRAVQAKRSGVVDGVETMIASGVVKYDAFGRKVAEGQPVTDNTTSLNTSDILNLTLTDYDTHDRPVKVTLPDGTASTAAYSIADGCLKTTLTDANGHVTDIYKDIRGRDRKTVRHADGQEVETSFHYNAIGELLSVVHPNKELTSYEYDGLGRKTSVSHPDAGLTTYEYDAAGNMTAKQTPNLRAANGKIRYTYDYERLSEIVYPKNIYNRVTYTYGDTTETAYNRAGRLKLVEDGSGGEAYYYGKLGEVTKTVKTILLAETDIRTYIWEADYDSRGRVNSMTYPDGEVVTYGYDKGGNLLTMMTEKEGDAQTLIAEQRYDKYGNLTYRKMGDGSETTYDYDEKRLHLNTMSLTSNGVRMMENAYTYDNVDNILGISNSAQPSGEIGGTFSHSYQYDALNRLVSAGGTAMDKSYESLMQYDVMSNLVRKDSVYYDYDTPGHPDAVSRAGGKIFSYDADGNPVSVEDTTANTLRVMQWDEEGRLQSLGDDGYVSRYTYNHAGERVVKSHGRTTVAFVNGAPQGVLWHDRDNWTMYVSPYMVVSPDRFMKHYYAGSQRIASKIGTGSFNNLYDPAKASVTAGQKDYAERLNQITQSRNDYYAALGIPPGPPTAKGIYGEAEYRGEYGDYMTAPLGDYDTPDNWPVKPYKRPYGGTPGPPVMYEKPSNPEDEGAGYGFKSAGTKEKDVYFYHSDHLGSTSYITDRDGNATQFVSYKPYGEALVDEHATSFETPWKFNGKELDSETGLYYYGARYYEPTLAVWYGVDALAEKYPSMGGYVYCAGNPVRLVDVDGNDGYVVRSDDGTIVIKSTIVYSKSDLDNFNKKTGENYTLSNFQNDVDIYYNSRTFMVNINDCEYIVRFDISVDEVRDDYVDETKLPIGYSKMSFGGEGSAGRSAGNSIRIITPQLCSESEETGATLSHEIGHTLGLKDSFDMSSGCLMSYSVNRELNVEEVREIILPVVNTGFSQTIVGRRNKRMKQW